MHRVILLVALAGALGSSCQKKYVGALDVKVTVAPKLVADCLRISVLDGTNELRWATFPRVAGQTEYQVGVEHLAAFPTNVYLVGSAWIGNCADESSLKLNSRAAAVPATFPESAVGTVEVSIGVPSSSLDADGDGYAGGTNGADCNDSDKTIFPGSVQLCNVNADTDCDGLIACADPDCASSPDCANPPNTLVLDGLPLSQLRYDCMGPFTLSLNNATGPRTATVPVTVSLTASRAAQFFEGAGCNTGTDVTSTTIPFLSGSKQLWARFTDVGTTTVSAAASGLTTATKNLDVFPQAVAALKLMGLPASLPAGTCSASVTVSLFDALDRATQTTGGVSLGLQASPADSGGNFFITADCSGSPSSILAVAPGQTGAVVYFKSNRAGPVAVTANAAGGVTTTSTVQITSGAATQLAFLNTPLSLKTTDSCSLAALDLQSQDALGNTAPAPSDTPLLLSGPSGVTFYAGSGCSGGGITSATLTQGSAGLKLWLKASGGATSGKVQITAQANYTPGTVTQDVSVSTGPPTSVRLNGAAQSPVAGHCSGAAISLALYDDSGVFSSFSSATAVTLTSSGATGVTFWGDSNCTTTPLAGSFQLPAGISQSKIFFKSNTAPQTFSFTVAVAGIAAPATSANDSIVPDVPQTFTWSPASRVATAGQCSASFTLTANDQYGNPAIFKTDTPVYLTSPAPLPSSGVTFGVGGQCTTTAPDGSGLKFTANTGTLAVLARGTLAGDHTLDAHTDASVSTQVSATLTVQAATPTFSVSPSSATLNAGGCQQLSFNDKDTFGNAVNGTLSFSPLPSGMTVTTDSGCNTPYTTPAMTTSGAMTLYLKSTKSGSAINVTANLATASFGTLSTNMSISTIPGTPSVTFSPAGPLNLSAGVCTPLTVRSFDSFGNAVDSTVTFPSPPAGFTLYSGSSCGSVYSPVSTSSGTLGVSFKSLTAGAGATLTASVMGSSGTISVTTTPASVTPTLSSTTFSGTAGICSSSVTFTSKDTYGNALDGPFTPSSPDSALAFYSSNDCSTLLGTPTTSGGTIIFWYKTTKAGGTTISGTVNGGATSASASVTTATGLVLNLKVNPNAASPSADTCVDLTYTSADQYGNPVDGTFSFFGGLPTGFTGYVGGGCATPLSGNPPTSSGVITVSVKPTIATTAMVVGSIGGKNATSTFTTSPVANFTPTFSPASFPSVRAGDCTGFTFTNQDVHGNAVTGALNMSGTGGISFWQDGACNTTPLGTPSTDASGVVHGYFLSTSAGSASISGSVAGHTATASVTTSAATESKLVFTSAATSVVAGNCSPAITVQLQDPYGNPVNKSSYAINLGLSPDASPTFMNAGCTGAVASGLSNSSSMSFSFKGSVAGTPTLTASGTGLPSVTSATQGWTVTSPPATKLVFSTAPPGSLGVFGCSNAVVVQAQSSTDLVAKVSGDVTVNLASSLAAAALTFYSTSDCSGAPITSVTIPSGSSDSPSFYLLATGSGLTNVTAADAALALTTTPMASVNVTGTGEKLVLAASSADVEAGGCVPITATRTKSDGTTLITKGTSTITATSGDTSVNLFQSADCSTTPLTSLAIPNGSSAATIYAHGKSTATTPFAPALITVSESNSGLIAASVTEKSYPLVRRGNCSSAGSSMDCALSPALPAGNDVSRSMLFFQATTGQANAADAFVQCDLATTPGSVHCVRGASGGTMAVQYQVVSWGRPYASGGVSVQHVPAQVVPSALPANVAITAVADLTKAFVLSSFTAARAAATSSGDFVTTQLTSTTNVTLDSSQNPDAGLGIALQVVQMAGARVDRGMKADAGTVKTVTGTFALSSPQTSRMTPLFTAESALDTGACKLDFRGTMSGATLTASRGNTVALSCSTNSVDRFSWEIIEWPAGTTLSSATVSISNSNTSNTGTLTGYVDDRTLIYAPQQGSGQASGENETTNPEVDYGRAAFTCAGTTLTATRGSAQGSTGTSKFTVYAVTFNP